MRFSFFAVLSGLATLAVVNALPAENLQRGAPSKDISKLTKDDPQTPSPDSPDPDCLGVSLVCYANE